ncbi:MAG: ABC transporter substrate-binding protein [Atopobiaceae bacterium]|nr:ABC transporter substrate-binding protein [Atopobiaceae bacterium]
MKRNKVGVILGLVLALLLAVACTPQNSTTAESSSSAATEASASAEQSTTEQSAAEKSAASSEKSTAEASASEASTSESSSSAAAGKVRLMALNGPTGIGMAKLTENDAYDVRFAGAADEVVSAVSSGSVDIAAVPSNLASTLYNKTQGGVQMIAVNTYGSLYLLERGETVSSLADLSNKHVYATGAGANPQYIFEYLLTQAGIDLTSGVEIEYLPEHSELAALVASGEAELALLPEPFVSVAKAKAGEDVRVALNMGEVWNSTTGSELAMGCVIVRTDFAAENSEAVEQFLSDLAASVEYTSQDVAGAAQLCADLGILPNAQVAAAAIPQCSLVCVTGADARSAVENYLGVLLESNPKSVGGALPQDDFYYQK